MSESKKTTDHEEIKKWVEERNGKPSMVKATEKNGSGMLRIDFPGYSGEDSLEEVPWEDFFRVFEEQELAFLYQEETADGGLSRFNRFVNRD